MLRPLAFALKCVVVCALLCLLAPVAHARPFDLTGTDWEGCAELVRLAKGELNERIVATERLDLSTLRPEDSLILLHPVNTLDKDSLGRFMKAGGRVILLDDFGTGDGLLEHFGMERVAAPEHPANALRKNPQLAIAEPASAHPVVSDVTRVVTNHPTGLRHPDLSPILKIRVAPDAPNGEQDVVIAVAGAVGQGRLLVVGDPSIVMNSMLRYPGNRAFAKALVRYAGDDDVWGRRAGHVYILTGPFELHGSYGEEPSAFSDLAERVRALQDSLSQVRRDGVPPWLAYLLAVAVGLGLVVWVGASAGRVHKATTPRFTRKIPLAAQGGVAGHAAVIGGPKTSRALAMLELKSALEEELCALLALEAVPGPEALVQKVRAQGLVDAHGVSVLERLLSRMAQIETMVVLSRRGGSPIAGTLAGGAAKVTDEEVLMTARQIRAILDQARGGKAPAHAAA